MKLPQMVMGVGLVLLAVLMFTSPRHRARDVPAKPWTRQSFQILAWRPSSPHLASTFIRTALCQSSRPEPSVSPV
jgi:hypothetical protein